MVDQPRYRHGLESVLASLPVHGGGNISLHIHSQRAYLNLRGPADARDFGAAVQAQLGTALPTRPNTVREGRQRIFWLGPDEWLIEIHAVDAGPLQRELGRALSASPHSLNDVSGGLTCLSLEGGAARELLSRGCTLDLHPTRFGAGDCAQTGLARAAVLLVGNGDPARVEIIVRRSFAAYVVRWLVHSGGACGLRLQPG